MKVAALQFCPAYMDVASNHAAVTGWLHRCDADLAVLPELCTTGYFFRDADQLHELAMETFPAAVEFLRETAREKRMILVAGIAEPCGGLVYNSACTFLPDGQYHTYRKVHLFAEEKRIFTPGDLGFPVIRWNTLVLGTMICYDWRFPEAMRTLALKGAQVVTHPSNLVAAPALWKPVMVTRSVENRVFTVTANRNGTEVRGDDSLVFHGSSQIVDGGGRVLSEADDSFEGWITADIDPGKAENKRFSPWNDIFDDRRPETYEL